MKKINRRVNIQVYQDEENVVPKKVKIERDPTVERRAFVDIKNISKTNEGTGNKICLKTLKKPTLRKTKPIKKEQEIRVVWDYSEDIYKYLILTEDKFLIKKDYLDGQSSFTNRCRSILIDWMIEIHGRFDLAADTLHLAVYALDKYMELDSTNVTRENAQLVAATCLYLASKFEEAMPIDQSDLIQTCDPAITAMDLHREEVEILTSLECRLNLPLPIDFLRRFSVIAGLTATEYTLAKYFTDASLISYELVGERPSILAAGCLYLALAAFRDTVEPQLVWTARLASQTMYSYDDFSHVLRFIAASIIRSSTSRLQSVRVKYSKTRYFSVSLLPSCQPSNGVITRFYSS